MNIMYFVLNKVDLVWFTYVILLGIVVLICELMDCCCLECLPTSLLTVQVASQGLIEHIWYLPHSQSLRYGSANHPPQSSVLVHAALICLQLGCSEYLVIPKHKYVF